MAAGDRTIKIQEIHIARGGGQINYSASWTFFVEDSTGAKQSITSGSITGNFGSPANFAQMTGAQINTQVVNDVVAAQSSGVPAGTVS